MKIVEEIQRSAVGTLVRRHDVNARPKPSRVLLSDLVARAAIENDGMRQVLRIHMVLEAQHVGRLAVLEGVAPAVKRYGCITERHRTRRHDATQPQIDVEVARESCRL